jgi:hypothetical protein
MHPPELQLKGGWTMALRTFTDSRGEEWQVWNIEPMFRTYAESDCSAPDGAVAELERKGTLYTPGLEGGWLCFDNGSEKRRLTPIPGGWEDAPDEALEAFCRRAASVRRARVATA